MRTRMLTAAIAPLLFWPACIFGPGCAGERAAEAIARQSGEAMTVLLHTAGERIDDLIVESEGRIQDPHYRVTAMWATGLILDIGLDGLYVDLDVQGTGAGLPSPEAAAQLQAALRAQLGERYPGDEFVAELLAATWSTPTSRPAPP